MTTNDPSGRALADDRPALGGLMPLDELRAAVSGLLARTNAREVARRAGVPDNRLDTFLRLVDLTGVTDLASVETRVSAALHAVPEFNKHRDALADTSSPGGTPDSAEVDRVADEMRTQLSFSHRPANTGPAGPGADASDEVAAVAAQMRAAAGL